jgi:DNA-binding HxlR family transcriptional regulator
LAEKSSDPFPSRRSPIPMRLSKQKHPRSSKTGPPADGDHDCAIGRLVDLVWDRWSILILNEALGGVTTFEAFRARLLIAPNILSKRLTAMVEAGLLRRRLYTWHPPRFEYVLTANGEAFGAVIEALTRWSNRDDG